jgi:hypothetical protein
MNNKRKKKRKVEVFLKLGLDLTHIPPRPSLPAVSSSLDTETPEQSWVDEKQLELAVSSPWTSILSKQASSKGHRCRKEAKPPNYFIQ